MPKRKQRKAIKDLEHIKYLIDKNKTTNELFCQPCDRNFEDENSIKSHQKTKKHKQRLKDLKNIFDSEKIKAVNNFYN